MADAIPIHHTKLNPELPEVAPVVAPVEPVVVPPVPEVKPEKPPKAPKALPVETEYGTLMTTHAAYRKDN
jgi:hypothetical protein